MVIEDFELTSTGYPWNNNKTHSNKQKNLHTNKKKQTL